MSSENSFKDMKKETKTWKLSSFKKIRRDLGIKFHWIFFRGWSLKGFSDNNWTLFRAYKNINTKFFILYWLTTEISLRNLIKNWRLNLLLLIINVHLILSKWNHQANKLKMYNLKKSYIANSNNVSIDFSDLAFKRICRNVMVENFKNPLNLFC